MNKPVKIVTIGNSAGVILPKEVPARLHARLGDSVYLSESASGFQVTAFTPDFEAKMAAAETIMREDREILRVLAR